MEERRELAVQSRSARSENLKIVEQENRIVGESLEVGNLEVETLLVQENHLEEEIDLARVVDLLQVILTGLLVNQLILISLEFPIVNPSLHLIRLKCFPVLQRLHFLACTHT
jgi:hypothetical protein